MNSLKRPSRKDQPRCRWWINPWDWYCVAIPMRLKPELRQFDRAKSMMRNFPPNGTAGFARHSVSAPRRVPRPPARTMATVWRASCAMVERSGAARGSSKRFGTNP